MELSEPFPDHVDGGIIIRDIEGHPTGMRSACLSQLITLAHSLAGIFIDNAQSLIKKPPLTDHDLTKRFNRTIGDALSSGLTSLHDAGFDPISLKFFKRSPDIHLRCTMADDSVALRGMGAYR
jgi:hypothetical protein